MMITEEFEIITSIYEEINDGLLLQVKDFEDFSYTFTIHFKENITQESVKIYDKTGNLKQVVIDSDCTPNLNQLLIELHKMMRERGDRWRVFNLEYKDGKVKASFEYDRE